MRRLFGWVAYALGPLAFGLYYLWLLLANIGESRLHFQRPAVGPFQLVCNASGLRGKHTLGMTFYRTIFLRMSYTELGARGGMASELIQHELEHVGQWIERGRVRFAAEYARQWALRGYRANAFEVDARDASDRHT